MDVLHLLNIPLNNIPNEVDAIDFLLDDTCRGCNTKDRLALSYIFEPPIYAMFKQCTGLDPSLNTNAPNAICTTCIASCKAWQTFRNLCEETQKMFNQERYIKVETIDTENGLFEFDEKDQENNIKERNIDDETDQKVVSNQENVPKESMNNEASMSETDEDDEPELFKKPVKRVDKGSTFRDICPICSQSFTAPTRFKWHMFSHDLLKDLKCQKCEVPFEKFEDLNAHCQEMHPNECIRNYECKQCGKFYAKYHDLHNHVQFVHNHKYKEKNVLCEYCGIKLPGRSRFLLEHVEKAHSLVTPGIGIVANKIKAKKIKNLKCRKCDAPFEKTEDLTAHCEDKHPNEIILNYECKHCGVFYANYNDLAIHIRVEHMKKFKLKVNMCEYCGMNFSIQAHLLNHIEKSHSFDIKKNISDKKVKQKAFKCATCHMTFSVKCSLRRHEENHKISTLFTCVVCDKGFKTKTNMLMHSVSHLETRHCLNCGYFCDNEKAYKDHKKDCTSIFPPQRYPPAHLRESRLKPVCPLCKTQCTNISSLNKHLQYQHAKDEGVNIQEVLASVKTKVCDECPKKFVDEFALFRHKEQSHGPRKYKCHRCFEMFTSISTLRFHFVHTCKKRDLDIYKEIAKTSS